MKVFFATAMSAADIVTLLRRFMLPPLLVDARWHDASLPFLHAAGARHLLPLR